MLNSLVGEVDQNRIKYNCTICGYTTKHKSHAIRHMLNRHEDPELVPCDLCGRGFKEASLPNRTKNCKKRLSRGSVKLPSGLAPSVDNDINLM